MSWLRPLFWAVLALILLWLPIGVARLVEIKPIDPARCTLDAPICALLRH